jgi:hypothetical protein
MPRGIRSVDEIHDLLVDRLLNLPALEGCSPRVSVRPAAPALPDRETSNWTADVNGIPETAIADAQAIVARAQAEVNLDPRNFDAPPPPPGDWPHSPPAPRL